MTASPPKDPKDWLEQARERCEAYEAVRVHGNDYRKFDLAQEALEIGARTDLPRALAALQAADALVAVVQRLEQAESSVRLAGLGGHEVETMLAEARSARAAVRLARAAYLAARYGEPQEKPR